MYRSRKQRHPTSLTNAGYCARAFACLLDGRLRSLSFFKPKPLSSQVVLVSTTKLEARPQYFGLRTVFEGRILSVDEKKNLNFEVHHQQGGKELVQVISACFKAVCGLQEDP
jgi:hypothetical protein